MALLLKGAYHARIGGRGTTKCCLGASAFGPRPAFTRNTKTKSALQFPVYRKQEFKREYNEDEGLNISMRMRDITRAFYDHVESAQKTHERLSKNPIWFLGFMISGAVGVFWTVKSSVDWATGETHRNKTTLTTAANEAKEAKRKQAEHEVELKNLKERVEWMMVREQERAKKEEEREQEKMRKKAAAAAAATPPKVL